jgi:hypothetical protein
MSSPREAFTTPTCDPDDENDVLTWRKAGETEPVNLIELLRPRSSVAAGPRHAVQYDDPAGVATLILSGRR